MNEEIKLSLNKGQLIVFTFINYANEMCRLIKYFSNGRRRINISNNEAVFFSLKQRYVQF